MDQFEEETLEHHRRVEKIIQDFEDDEAKLEEATKKIVSKVNFGPAFDILRYFYLLEQQGPSTDEERMRCQQDFHKIFQISEEPNEEQQEVENDDQTKDTDQVSQPTESQGVPSMQPSVPVPPQRVATQLPFQSVPPQPQSVLTQPPQLQPAPTQPSLVRPVLTQPPQIQPGLNQPQPGPTQPILAQPVLTQPPQPQPVLTQPQPGPTQPPAPPPQANQRPHQSSRDETLAKRQELTRQAETYEVRYRMLEKTRQPLLTAVVKNILNKLRKDTYASLLNDLIGFLQGQEHQLAQQTIKIQNNDERLYALARLAVLILAQLLDGDLTDVKNEIFLPLIGDISSRAGSQEFSTIFLHQLYKRCPYTIPSYPERTATMTDEQYKEILGYTIKKEGNQTRFESETEFLNRMNGLIRLFCKLMVSGKPPFDANLSVAWRWIADVVNLEPRHQITAILLRVFLEEAGEKMTKVYGIQFRKIIQLIRTNYWGLLERQTSADQISRLKMILQQWNSPR